MFFYFQCFTCALSIKVLIVARNVNLGGDHFFAELIFTAEIKGQPNVQTNFFVFISTLCLEL